MRSFGSDNNAGVHPAIMEALMAANDNHALAYGDDLWTEEASGKIKELLGANAEPYFVFNGTGANVIGLRACCQPFHAIIAAKTAHIAVDECGSPVFMTGAALKEVDTPDGKLTPDLIRPLLTGWGFEHHSQPKVIYLSQCTELGTVYTCEEVQAIASLAHQHKMYLFMDGARIANAAFSLQKSIRQITVEAGVDIMSFGGTKNGCMMAESVIAFHPALTENLKYIRKQSTQLYSKMRFVSAQFSAYLKDDLWYRNAENANKMAQLLRKGIEKFPQCVFTQVTQANTLLLKMPPAISQQLLEKHFFYTWDEKNNEIRLVTSWDTTPEDISTFLDDLAKCCIQ